MPLYVRDFVYPPIDGSVTIPETLDFHWKYNADLPIYAFHQDGKESVTEVSYLEFGRACHRVAHILAGKLPPEARPVVAFMALTDSLLYQAITIGMMRMGVVPFPISPRNTAAAVVNLLQKTSCHYLVTTPFTLKELVDGIKTELSTNDPGYELMIIETPALRDIFPKLGAEREEDPFTPYVNALKPRRLDDIALYLHSSGSTGFPKAIPQTHWILVNWAAFPSTFSFRDNIPRVRLAAMHLPPFHTLGIYAQVLHALYGCVTISLYPPVTESPETLPVMPSPDNILDHLRRTKSNAIITIPTLLQIWAQDQKSVDTLSKLEFVSYSGGAVAPKLGDFMVASGVRLSPSYGGTEFGSPTYPYKRKGDEKDWSYMEFDPRSTIRWIPQGDGTYECHFLSRDTHRLPIENLPDVRGYATADLFEPHPTKDYLWKIVGRVDDVIIHSSGEKTVPAPIEDIIMSSIHVMGVVMFGQTHDQPGVLIEPKPAYSIDVEDEQQVAKFRNLIWPVIDDANKVAPTFSRIFKEMILVTNKNKPLPRAGKGTVMRKLSLKEYNDKIEALYATVESTQATESVEPPKVWERASVTNWILDQLRELNNGRKIVPGEDLFEQGVDSLSATILRRRITGALQSVESAAGAAAIKAITQNTVYTYPTVDLLAEYIVRLVGAAESSSTDNHTSHKTQSRTDLIEAMIAKYRVDPPVNGHAEQGKVVLLTGSTGNLGSQVLEALLKDSRVKRVYALNRPSSGSEGKSLMERQVERFVDKGLDKMLLAREKAVFVEAELAKERLGLDHSVYEEISTAVNVIIHTAWKLDFNLSLASFESSIRGTRNLIGLAHASPLGSGGVKFIFTSSVASALSWDQGMGRYPEEVVHDPKYSVGNGYGESKYVTERILAASGLNAISLRIGQISGGKPNGAWATTDWIPILVKSSLALGALPMAHGVVSWIPMDAVSSSILDIAFYESSERLPPAMNIVHSKPVEWNIIIQYIADALVRERRLGTSIKLISFQEWFDLLETHAVSATEDDQIRIPAIKLRGFFKQMADGDLASSPAQAHVEDDAEVGGLTKFSIEKIQRISETMQSLEPLTYQDVERWVKYWNQAGLFD